MFKSLRYIIFKGLVYTLLITIVSSNYNLCSPDGILEVSNSYAKSVHLSTDHEYMVVGSVDNGTYIYKHNGFFFEEHQVFRDASGSIVSVSVSYDHNIIISGTADTSTYVYEK